MPSPESLDYFKILTDLIQKQMVILGPDITFAKVKNVGNITIDTSGRVIKIESPNPNELLQRLVDQFMELSEEVSRKSVESLITSYPSLQISTPQKNNHIEKDSAPSPKLAMSEAGALKTNHSIEDNQAPKFGSDRQVGRDRTSREEVNPDRVQAAKKERNMNEKPNTPSIKTLDQIQKFSNYSGIDGLKDDDIKKVTDLFADKN